MTTTTDLWCWYETRAGQHFLAAEKALLDGALANLFGYHLLQLGSPAAIDLVAVSRIRHQIRMDASLRPHGGNLLAGLHAEAEAIPIRTDSIDLVLLPHTLDLSDDPHTVLREVDRVLVPEGHVVLLGFNPWSAWGLSYYCLRRWRRELPQLKLQSAHRTVDWLRLLGFDILHCQPFYFRPLLGHEGMMDKLAWMETLGRRCWPLLASGYQIVARKQVTTMTAIRPTKRQRRRFIPKEAVEPARRSSECRKQ